MAPFSALMTLDGSPFAEEALSLLPFLQSVGAARVQLVSVWEEAADFSAADQRLAEASQRGRALLTAYLDAKALQLTSTGLEVQASVRGGNAADEILRAAEESKPDLIVIATHGRTGIDRWRLGSVADKLVRESSCPTLVIGPNVKTPLPGYHLSRILVPLDGSQLAEAALPLAAALARRSGATLELIDVVSLPTTWTADPYGNFDIGQILTWLEDGAKQYLAKLNVPGVVPIRTVTQYAAEGIAPGLLAHLVNKPADLVVMTSHGRHGIQRTALGSVTDELLRGPAPVLVLRPGHTDLAQLIASAEPSAPV